MKYLLYLAKTYSIPIVSPLVEYLKKTANSYAFYASSRVKAEFPPEWIESNVVSSIAEARNYKPDFVLSPGNSVDFRIPGIKVQLFHGLGVEKPVHYYIRHLFDVYLTSGPFVTKQYLALQKKYHYFDVIETGWIKIDWILNYQISNLKERFKIPLDRSIILYAPTFSTGMESASELLSILPDCIKDDEYWLLKFHEFMPLHMIRPFEQLQKSNFRILRREDITPYLHLADILISDTSSVVYEFMALDKPVVTYKTIAKADKACNITEPNELRHALDECILYPNWLKIRRDITIKEINPYLDSKTSERIVKALESLNLNEYPKRHKPLNLFRKSQIIYHSIFRKGYLR